MNDQLRRGRGWPRGQRGQVHRAGLALRSPQRASGPPGKGGARDYLQFRTGHRVGALGIVHLGAHRRGGVAWGKAGRPPRRLPGGIRPAAGAVRRHSRAHRRLLMARAWRILGRCGLPGRAPPRRNRGGGQTAGRAACRSRFRELRCGSGSSPAAILKTSVTTRGLEL